MMMRSLFTKLLYDKRWFIVGWSLGVGVMVVLVMLFYPAFSHGQIDELSKSIPEQLKGLIGDPSLYKTIPGYVAQELFDIRVSIMIMVMAIILGVSLSVGDEEKGSLRTILATPLSRPRIALEKWLVAVVVMGVVSLVAMLSILAGIALINETINIDIIWQLGLLMWLFGVTATAIPLGVGLVTGNRGTAMVLATLVTLASFILSTFGKAVDWLQPFEKYSLLHYFDTTKLVVSGVSGNDLILLGSLCTILLIASTIGFRYRDVT